MNSHGTFPNNYLIASLLHKLVGVVCLGNEVKYLEMGYYLTLKVWILIPLKLHIAVKSRCLLGAWTLRRLSCISDVPWSAQFVSNEREAVPDRYPAFQLWLLILQVFQFNRNCSFLGGWMGWSHSNLCKLAMTNALLLRNLSSSQGSWKTRTSGCSALGAICWCMSSSC